MLTWTDRIALYLGDLVFLLLVATSVAALVSKAARLMLLRLAGRVVRAITEESRAADRAATAKHETAAELQKALRELGVAVAGSYLKPIEVAAAHVRILCPDTRQAVDALLAPAQTGSLTQEVKLKLLDAVRDSAADCLKV